MTHSEKPMDEPGPGMPDAASKRLIPVQAAAQVPVVAIGASAGGLKAFMQLLEALPPDTGMAFVLIQHLSPDHESLMPEILRGKTKMPVSQIEAVTRVEMNHVYIGPPGQAVSLTGNSLTIVERDEPGHERFPFDAFLSDLAAERGARSICVILSGTGDDGSRGLKAIKRAGGYGISQDPDDADAAGMPRSAILTGDVDAVLTAPNIPTALINWCKLSETLNNQGLRVERHQAPGWLSRIIDTIRERTGYDFTPYKPGTLVRRISRRISLASPAIVDVEGYIELLKSSAQECEALAADLLINVTQFFRDPDVFRFLEERIFPELLANHAADRPFRVWVAGCSSGEEAWSIAILLREAIENDGRGIQLQILASDTDPDAVATARAATYPASIVNNVSESRLARFFVADPAGYRVRDELRSAIVFTVQNLLSDPPFARLDMISCRNVLIYLGPDAQSKVISLFHFALVAMGVLLLGASETAGETTGRFEIVSKSKRIYRRVGPARPQDTEMSISLGNPGGESLFAQTDLLPLANHRYADICRREVAHIYTPASVLITRQGLCLHFLGPVEEFLSIPRGAASFDVLSMTPVTIRADLRDTISSVTAGQPSVTFLGTMTDASGAVRTVQVKVLFVADNAEELLLITFQDETAPVRNAALDECMTDGMDAPALANQLEVRGLRQELDHLVLELERALGSERKIRREALRLNEEYQSTNEELVTSKEELQSLNEELTVLNSQLQEALEQQRTTSDDLQYVLFSTNVATVFLDLDFHIRFFTPTAKTVFSIRPSDVGRPLADLRWHAADPDLLEDAKRVVSSQELLEREVVTNQGKWHIRRILPYRGHDDRIEGVVISYMDVNEQHLASEALKVAIRRVEQASIAKTRFLASASHDLRQPLQTLTFIQKLLAREASSPASSSLIKKMDQAVNTMSGMLSAMLDINQIEAGVINFEVENLPVHELLQTMCTEFGYQVEAKSLELRLIRSSAVIRTDRRLFQQMIRNLLSNAIRYTDKGRISVGCRKRGDKLRIEIWDTGIGIAAAELPDIFGEYHKAITIGRAASEGRGLGLAIVQRLADLLDHRVQVCSELGRGSVFSVEVPVAEIQTPQETGTPSQEIAPVAAPLRQHIGHILIAEDDPDVRTLQELLLTQQGYSVSAASDVSSALALAGAREQPPDLLIVDYNLPGGRSGRELARMIVSSAGVEIPVIILTGDISAATQRAIAGEGFTQLNKPVRPEILEAEIQRLLKQSPPNLSEAIPEVKGQGRKARVVIVDDDGNFNEALSALLQAEGFSVTCFVSGQAFLSRLQEFASGDEVTCILIDAYLGSMDGLDVLDAIQKARLSAPVIMITGSSDVQMAVRAMKAGAADFFEKPIELSGLMTAIDHALVVGRDKALTEQKRLEAVKALSRLTAREHEILNRILDGQPNKNIAADLGISQRTVESHRASVMTKADCKTLPALVRLAIRASSSRVQDA